MPNGRLCAVLFCVEILPQGKEKRGYTAELRGKLRQLIAPDDGAAAGVPIRIPSLGLLACFTVDRQENAADEGEFADIAYRFGNDDAVQIDAAREGVSAD